MSAQSPVLLITGATGGIGQATARLARTEGWRLVLVARSPKVHDLVADLGGPEHVRAVAADVCDESGLRRAVDEATAKFGGIDAALVNAGITAGPVRYRPDPSEELPEESAAGWREMVSTNVLGVALTVRAVVNALVASHGRIVIMGSVLGRYAMSGSLYSATKYAVAGIAETARLELVGTGVGVTLIEPGPVATAFAGRSGLDVSGAAALAPHDVAHAVVWALTQPSGVDVNELLLRPHGATP